MSQTVKGVISRSKGAPTEVVDVVIPDPGPRDAVVSIKACGVCHTDLAYKQGGINDEYPFLLGHEAAGPCCAQALDEWMSNHQFNIMFRSLEPSTQCHQHAGR